MCYLPGPLAIDREDQMSDMWDAAGDKWTNLEGKRGAKAGYIDGPSSVWPAEAWQAFSADPCLHITVLADERGEVFDGETGDAGPAAVAAAVANRIADRKWAVLYANQDQLGEYLQALAAKSIRPSDRSLWPAPGVYLWLADPSGNIAAGRWTPPVDPVAVQDEWTEGFDHSTLHVELAAAPAPSPAPTPAPQPAPAPLQEVTVQLPVLTQGARGPAVGALQKLLTGLAVDDDFGPLTHGAVTNFQSAHGLAVDGVVGAHTWGALLGAPQ